MGITGGIGTVVVGIAAAPVVAGTVGVEDIFVVSGTLSSGFFFLGPTLRYYVHL